MNPVLGALAISVTLVVFLYSAGMLISSLMSGELDDEEEDPDEDEWVPAWRIMDDDA